MAGHASGIPSESKEGLNPHSRSPRHVPVGLDREDVDSGRITDGGFMWRLIHPSKAMNPRYQGHPHTRNSGVWYWVDIWGLQIHQHPEAPCRDETPPRSESSYFWPWRKKLACSAVSVAWQFRLAQDLPGVPSLAIETVGFFNTWATWVQFEKETLQRVCIHKKYITFPLQYVCTGVSGSGSAPASRICTQSPNRSAQTRPDDATAKLPMLKIGLGNAAQAAKLISPLTSHATLPREN